ncbi:AAA family ATPase, partial [Candidatus Riflebacteria bacterium]
MNQFLRVPAEKKFLNELKALSLRDARENAEIPPGWKLSPQSTLDFLMGHNKPVEGENSEEVTISAKYIGNRREIELCIATLCSDRALMMIGPPGTGKSCVSEWLTAAISGTSRLILQGNSGVTEDQIKYSWNFSLLLQKGPTKEALKPSPIMLAMGLGQIIRFEEVTRCPQEVQDALI